MEHQAAHVLDYGGKALRYVLEELETASHDFNGPLALRLLNLRLGAPFSFLTEPSAPARDFRKGGVDDGTSDRCLTVAISKWLAQTTAGTTRILLLEDPLARRTDPTAPDEARYFGERVYFTGMSGDDPNHIERVFRRLAGYPGVGVLSQLPTTRAGSAELTEDTIESLVAAASVWCFRNSGFSTI